MTTIVRPGEDAPSCVSCRYFTGHTSWCRIPKGERTIAELTDGRKLRPLDMLTLAQARRTLAWAEEVAHGARQGKPQEPDPLVECRRRDDGSLMTWAEYERVMSL